MFYSTESVWTICFNYLIEMLFVYMVRKQKKEEINDLLAQKYISDTSQNNNTYWLCPAQIHLCCLQIGEQQKDVLYQLKKENNIYSNE